MQTFALALGCPVASTASDLVVTVSVLAISVSKMLLKERSLRALLTHFSAKSGSSLQPSSIISAVVVRLCVNAGVLVYAVLPAEPCAGGKLQSSTLSCHSCVIQALLCQDLH